jgi:hypothetical protein
MHSRQNRATVSASEWFDDHLKPKRLLHTFWARAIQYASLSSQRHFLEVFTTYLHGVVAEALDREQGHKRSIEDCLKLRRYTVGVRPCFPLYEMGMDLPDEVFYHPVVMDLAECITDLVVIDNISWYEDVLVCGMLTTFTGHDLVRQRASGWQRGP